jgi:hypothetical protein
MSAKSCPNYSILLADTIVVGSGSYSLGPGESLEVGVRFAPTSSGTETCMVSSGSSCSNVSCTGDGQDNAEYIVHLGIDKTWLTFWNYGACDSGGSGVTGGSSCHDATPIGVADAWVDTSGAYWAWVKVGKEFYVRATCMSGISQVATIRVTCEYKGWLSGGGDGGSARAALEIVVQDTGTGAWVTKVFDERESDTGGNFDLEGTVTKSFYIPLVAGRTYRAFALLTTEAEANEAGGWESNFGEEAPPPNQVKITRVEVGF